MPLQTNARLTRVQAAGAGESYDGPEPTGPDKYADATGAGAYLRERRDRRQPNVVKDRLLIVDHDTPAIEWKVGDTVTFARRGTVETGKVKLVETPDIDDPDIPAELRTVRLTLEEV